MNSSSTSHNESANCTIQTKNNKKRFVRSDQFKSNVQRGTMEFNQGAQHFIERIKLTGAKPSPTQEAG